MRASRSRRGRSPRSRQETIGLETLEGRLVLAAGIGFDASRGIVSIVGSDAADVAVVEPQGKSIVVSLSGVASRTFTVGRIKSIAFSGLGGSDSFTNNTGIRCRADGGDGDDTLHGGTVADDLRGGDGDDAIHGNAGADLILGGLGDDALHGGAGDDREFGDAGRDAIFGEAGHDALHGGSDDDDIVGDLGRDSLWGESGDDRLDGGVGVDRIHGGAGLDREDDVEDRFRDGDDDGDGYDNDHDRPVNPAVITPIVFAQSTPGTSTARIAGESANERDKDSYSFTASAAQTLTVVIRADANGRYAELEVKDGMTGRKLLEVEPSENGIVTAQLAVTAGKAYVIRIESPYDRIAVGYVVDLTLDSSPVSPIIGTEVVFGTTGAARLTGSVVGDDVKQVYSFTAATSGTLAVTIQPPANGRWAELEVENRASRRKLLELDPSQRRGRASGTIAVVAGQTYVIEIESSDDRLAADYVIDLQLT